MSLCTINSLSVFLLLIDFKFQLCYKKNITRVVQHMLLHQCRLQLLLERTKRGHVDKQRGPVNSQLFDYILIFAVKLYRTV